VKFDWLFSQLSLESGKFKLRGETMLSFLTKEGMERIDSMASQTNSQCTQKS